MIRVKEPNRVTEYEHGISQYEFERLISAGIDAQVHTAMRNDGRWNVISPTNLEFRLNKLWKRRTLNRHFEKFKKLKVRYASRSDGDSFNGKFIDLLMRELYLLQESRDDVELENVKYMWFKGSKIHGLGMNMRIGEINYDIKMDIIKSGIFGENDCVVYSTIKVSGLMDNPTQRGSEMFRDLSYNVLHSNYPTLVVEENFSTSYSDIISHIVRKFSYINDALKIGRHMEDDLEALTGRAEAIVKGEFDEFTGDDLQSLGYVEGVVYDKYELSSRTTPNDAVTFKYAGAPAYYRRVNGVNMEFKFHTSIAINYTPYGVRISQSFDSSAKPSIRITFDDDKDTLKAKEDILEILEQYNLLSSVGSNAPSLAGSGTFVCNEKNMPMRDKYAITKAAALSIDRYLSKLESASVVEPQPVAYELQPTDEEIEHAIDSLST